METLINKEVISKQECVSSVSHIRDSLYVLNGKWKLPIIFSLREKARRFNDLQKEMDGITPKVLAKELKELELNGFVIRTVYPTTPVTIIYEATSYSDTLRNVLEELKIWGARHREKIRESMRQQNSLKAVVTEK